VTPDLRPAHGLGSVACAVLNAFRHRRGGSEFSGAGCFVNVRAQRLSASKGRRIRFVTTSYHPDVAAECRYEREPREPRMEHRWNTDEKPSASNPCSIRVRSVATSYCELGKARRGS
jgi:hypothetical protein